MPKKKTLKDFRRLCAKADRAQKTSSKASEHTQKLRCSVRRYAGALVMQAGLLNKIRWRIESNYRANWPTKISLVAQKHQPNVKALAQLARLVHVVNSATLEEDTKAPWRSVDARSRKDIEVTFPDNDTAFRFIKKHKIKVQVNALKKAAKDARKEAERLENYIADLGMAKRIE